MVEGTTTEGELKEKYDAEEKRRADENIQKQLATIKAQLSEALASKKTPGSGTDLVEIPKYSTETERDIIEQQEVLLESSQYGQTSAVRKVHSLRAHAEGVIGEQIDNEDSLTRRVSHWGALEDNFDKKINERTKREGRLQNNVIRAMIIAGVFAVIITLIVELDQA